MRTTDVDTWNLGGLYGALHAEAGAAAKPAATPTAPASSRADNLKSALSMLVWGGDFPANKVDATLADPRVAKHAR